MVKQGERKHTPKLALRSEKHPKWNALKPLRTTIAHNSDLAKLLNPKTKGQTPHVTSLKRKGIQ
jgi:hypothetical protein